jgi:hypothetical protein
MRLYNNLIKGKEKNMKQDKKYCERAQKREKQNKK